MEGLIKGDVVVTPFPFSDFSQLKIRPALVLAILPGNDSAKITSQSIKNDSAISLKISDFLGTGNLTKESNIRPEKIHTIERGIIRYKVGTIKLEKLQEVIDKITEIFQTDAL
jgi:mRNA interferase MazF